MPFLFNWTEYCVPLINSCHCLDVIPAQGREQQVTYFPYIFVFIVFVPVVITYLISMLIVTTDLFQGMKEKSSK